MYKNLLNLTNKVAVVTGGGKTIGLACSQALGEFGAKVVVATRNPDTAHDGIEYLKKHDIDADLFQLEVTKPDKVRELAQTIEERYGKVDILVNNAGICHWIPAEETPNESWAEILDTNLNGVFWCSREFGKIMLKNKSGSIVNIGSISGDIINVPQLQSSYHASKGAVHHLTKSMAVEWAQTGVRVNAVAPGYIYTDMTAKADQNIVKEWLSRVPMGRWGETSDVGSVVAFLASDAASLMTGAIVTADGGYTAW